MKPVEIYHGNSEIVQIPEIRKTKYARDFSWGFYCTKSYEQAYRWALRRHEEGIVNVYSYVEDEALNILRFPKMTDPWLDFIAEYRNGQMHQISFHTTQALSCITFERSMSVNDIAENQ